jgi:hypothetical protein
LPSARSLNSLGIAIVAAGLVSERARQPTLADPGRSFDDQVLRLLDPLPAGERLEEDAIEPACGAVIDILDRGRVAQTRIAQTSLEPPILSIGGLMIEKKPEPFGVGQVGHVGIGGETGKRAGHAVQAKRLKLIEGGVGEHGT